jgi:hypothetical protein
MTATAMVMRVSALDTIISAEFDEMPGMRLTMPQVCRLWSITAREADDVIRSLIARGVLTLDRRGRVCRPEDQAA